MHASHYADFDLEITRIAKGRYRAQVVDSPAGQASVVFKRPVSDLELENFVLRIGRTRTGVRRIGSPEMQAAENFGKQLFDAVFQAELRDCLTSSLHQVDRQEIPGLRIKLRLVDVPELANLPWEYLYHPTLRRFIVLSTETPITRYLDLPRPVTPLAVSPPLRLLAIATSPPGYPALDVQREREKMAAALRGLEERGLIVLEWLETPTLFALQQRLRREPVHLFHFIGHGGWDAVEEDAMLLFEDEQGRGHMVDAGRLATILRDHRTLRLVVLNACEGARTSPTDPFAGVASALIQQGIPAVLAMQFEITDQAAIVLSQVFYEALADGYPAEAALTEARKAIFASSNDVEWGTPVLYLRAPDGRLFDLTAPPAPQREASEPAGEPGGQSAASDVQPAASEQGQPAASGPLLAVQAGIADLLEPPPGPVLAAHKGIADLVGPQIAQAERILPEQSEASEQEAPASEPASAHATMEGLSPQAEAELEASAADEASVRDMHAGTASPPPESKTQLPPQRERVESGAASGSLATGEGVALAAAPLAAVPLPTAPAKTVWLPALVAGVGWAFGWPIAVGIASTADSVAGSVVGLVLGWAVAGLATGLALRWLDPSIQWKQALLLVAGWLLSLAAGTAISWSTASTLGLAAGVALAGVLAALALLPRKPTIAWGPALIVGAGWGLGWVMLGMGAWDFVFMKVLAYGFTLADVLNNHAEDAPFSSLLGGGVLSGLVGAVLLAWFLNRLRPRA